MICGIGLEYSSTLGVAKRPSPIVACVYFLTALFTVHVVFSPKFFQAIHAACAFITGTIRNPERFATNIAGLISWVPFFVHRHAIILPLKTTKAEHIMPGPEAAISNSVFDKRNRKSMTISNQSPIPLGGVGVGDEYNSS